MLAGTFAVAALGSALLTDLWIRLARARRIEDLPGQRRLHSLATPRGGGIGISLVMIATCVLMPPEATGPASWPGLAAAIAAFSTIGMLDDLRPMPAWLKLFLQLAAAAFLLAALAPSGAIVWWLGIGLLAAYFINVWNFMDGSNGMVTGQSLLIALALSFWPGLELPTRLAAWALAGACAGFLPFNFPRARIFLGDAGSLLLGYSLGASAVLACSAAPPGWGRLGPLLLLAYPAFDMIFVVVNRLREGRKVYVGGKDHSNHRLASVIRCPTRTVLLMWCSSAALCASGLAVLWLNRPIPALLLSGLWMALLSWSGLRLSSIPVQPTSPR